MKEWLLGPEADVPGALFGIGYNFDYCLIAATEAEPGAACGPLLVGELRSRGCTCAELDRPLRPPAWRRLTR